MTPGPSRSNFHLVTVSVVLRALVLLSLAGTAACDAPLGAIRRSPPKGIEARAAAADAKAPDFTLQGTTGAVALSEVLAHDDVLLVFYRGHW
jgi:hypothetical protein